MNKPAMRDQLVLRHYIEARKPLVESEAAFAYYKEDLVTLRPGRDHSFVDAFVERMLRTFYCRALKVTSRSVQLVCSLYIDATFRKYSAQR